MFAKFEFIAGLVGKGEEITFTYDEKKTKVVKKELFDDVDFWNKPNPLLAKKQYKTKYGYKDKTYGVKTTPKDSQDIEYEFKKKTYGSHKRYSGEKTEFGMEKQDTTYTPAYKRDKFKSSWPTRTTNKKGNKGLGYKGTRGR